MSSKADILARIRRNPTPAAPLPELEEAWITYPDPVAHFFEVLTSVGGQGQAVSNGDGAADAIRQLPCLADARRIVCRVEGVALGNVDLAAVADPHDLADIDLAILPAEFAVAENGAVWVTDRGLPHRVLYFITQHLVLVVPRREIVHNLHEAYRRLKFEEPGYGLFISGPSKTADIEQSLVIGAHGPRSLTVLLCD
ncbi:MAG: LUD domain-containing protein [Pirellulaceae bacterium]